MNQAQIRRTIMANKILVFIGNSSNIIGIIGAVFSFLVWIKLRVQNKRLIELSKSLPAFEDFSKRVNYWREIHTLNPYAFAVSLIQQSSSIKGDVERFLQSKGHKWEKMPIVELNMHGIGTNNLEEYLKQLRIKRNEFEAKGATEVHLFFAGPVQAATLVGAMFDNWRPVLLYHKNRDTGNYEFWCPLIK
ncbi:MAG: SAVED domain-containing protein [Candidatus Scalindua rubra]|nr:SAVED domain-containing protein [Candidatus Scalindua rubra]